MKITLRVTFVRPPNGEIPDGWYAWSAAWRHPLHPNGCGPGRYACAVADKPWDALGAVIKKVLDAS